MQYRKIENTGLNISTVGLGTWAMGDDFFGKIDDDQSINAIHAAIDHGINFIDTAPAYGAGHSEKIVGKAIEGKRDQVTIATKVGVKRTEDDFIHTLKPGRIYKEIDDSLHRLKVDTIDLYQIHWPDPDTPLEDTVDALVKVKEQGKFRYLGVSNFSADLLEKIRSLTEVVTLQPHYSLLRRDIEAEVLPYCIKNAIGILSYGTLAGGILTGKFKDIPDFKEGDHRDRFYNYFHEPLWSHIQDFLSTLKRIAKENDKSMAQVVINWTIHRPGITCALVGAKSPSQAKSNAEGANWRLSAEEIQTIDHAYHEHLDEALEAETS